ncbi:ABC transporter permease subunit [Aquibacillus halophilus]|uniref:ABC transporter permease subunit n=2 Tax=Aquibacillus halophilus TaxID=930132 RepID=A0A6A8DHD7_9BACI|nr:ABC transporter permease subunit [Aquibacillus halophilus]MRH44640.1 ABC transporter permease subunit [Aquibacillus halophilus]
MQWKTIFKKEMLEYWRNFKWVWVPLVFILIAIMDPISTYYLPKILDAVGGLPDGAVFEMPEITPVAALMMSLSELSMFGVLVIVLMSMGLIAGERKSGVAELVLVKPVGYFTYISSKWGATLLLVWTSLIIGLLTSWYYVNLLYGDISFGALIQVIFFYGLWLTLVISITTFFNTLFKTPGIVGFLSIATIIVMSIFNQIFSHKITWFPNNLSSHIGDMLDSGSTSGELWGTALVTIIIIVALLFASLLAFRGKEMAN